MRQKVEFSSEFVLEMAVTFTDTGSQSARVSDVQTGVTSVCDQTLLQMVDVADPGASLEHSVHLIVEWIQIWGIRQTMQGGMKRGVFRNKNCTVSCTTSLFAHETLFRDQLLKYSYLRKKLCFC